ncbi:FecCD family ABC transporter permease [Photobacterium arenosum]|uniref:FecCD family ABC transporter permease n=1 Tax=Photobacterium arenosum TaxID=2774143 RepID=UPI00288BE906|nr:iron ABC transporter permease [Photobacterium arenosum]
MKQISTNVSSPEFRDETVSSSQLGALTEGGTLSTEAKPAYLSLVRRRLWLLTAMATLVVLLAIIDLSTGPSSYNLTDIARLLWVSESPIVLEVIVYDIRLPAVLAALVVGAGLSVAGTQMQTVLHNPLASPFTLGVSAAASFGAALGLVFGVTQLPSFIGNWAVPVSAFLMSTLAVLLIERITRWRSMSNELIILLGTTLVFTFTALLQGLQYAVPDRALEAVVFWTMGNLSRVNITQLGMIAVVLLLVMVYFMRSAWQLTAMQLGEERASAMGIPVARLRLQTILLSSVLASVCVSFVGTVGFVGLVAPHMARLLVGEDQRFLIPASALCGAALLSAASIAGKVVVPGQVLPIGIVTSLVGVPMFLALILRRVRG